MSCEYCQTFPHLPGCPNAPYPEEQKCIRCGGWFYGYELEDGVCKSCRFDIAVEKEMEEDNG